MYTNALLVAQLACACYLVSCSWYECGETRFTENEVAKFGPVSYGSFRASGPDDELNCTYNIEPSRSDGFILLKWKTFDVKSSMPSCHGDNLKVYTGCGRNRTALATFCSGNADQPFPIYSKSRCIQITLTSKRVGLREASTFSASYTIVNHVHRSNPRNCQGKSALTDSSGMIPAPIWSNSIWRRWRYLGYIFVECNWYVQVPNRTSIQIYVLNTIKDANNDEFLQASLTISITKPSGLTEDMVYHQGNYPSQLTSSANSFSIKAQMTHTSSQFLIGYVAFREEIKTNSKDEDEEDTNLGIGIVFLVIFGIFGLALLPTVTSFCFFRQRLRERLYSDFPSTLYPDNSPMIPPRDRLAFEENNRFQFEAVSGENSVLYYSELTEQPCNTSQPREDEMSNDRLPLYMHEVLPGLSSPVYHDMNSLECREPPSYEDVLGEMFELAG